MTELEMEAANLAATDILNAAKDFFAAHNGDLHEFEVRLVNDGRVILCLPNGKTFWIARDNGQST